MCGIFGYVNCNCEKSRREIATTLLNGLKRMEYRGYDSAGIYTETNENRYALIKSKGKVDKLIEEVDAFNFIGKTNNHCGIAHTRWATHGEPCVKNCHPHSNDEFTVIHNGIITNHKDIKKYIGEDKYMSDTDTESAVHLASKIYNQNPTFSFLDVIRETVKHLEGAYAFIFLSKHFPNEMVAVRKSSPLLIGLKAEKISKYFNSNVFDKVEYFFASDIAAIIEHTKKIIYLDDGDIAYVKDGKLNFENKKNRVKKIKDIDMSIDRIMKGDFDDYMLKEIYEQPESVLDSMRGRVDFKKLKVRLGGIEKYINTINESSRIVFIACGTSFHSALAVLPLFEELVRKPIQVELASDFVDRDSPILRNDCYIFISQSGETADLLLALRKCLRKNTLCIGITNVVGSTVGRETQCGIYINAGPEIGVASTKAFTSQVTALVLVALRLSQNNNKLKNRRREIIQSLKFLPKQIKFILRNTTEIKNIAKNLCSIDNLLIVGRHYNRAIALEGALKIKEIAYIHTEGILGGELKHGPLALVDENINCIILIDKNQKIENAYHEIIARKGNPIIITSEDLKGNYKGKNIITVPLTSNALQGLLNVIPLQLLSYYTAKRRGLDVDCPRNLAKSVTTE